MLRISLASIYISWQNWIKNNLAILTLGLPSGILMENQFSYIHTCSLMTGIRTEDEFSYVHTWPILIQIENQCSFIHTQLESRLGTVLAAFTPSLWTGIQTEKEFGYVSIWPVGINVQTQFSYFHTYGFSVQIGSLYMFRLQISNSGPCD